MAVTEVEVVGGDGLLPILLILTIPGPGKTIISR